MSEREPIVENREQEPQLESGPERRELSPDQLEQLDNELRQTGEKARADAQETAISGREKTKTDSSDRLGESGSDVIGPSQREQSYRKTMRQVQKELPLAARTFSKVIHQPVIEKTSELVGATLARPTSLLTGSLCAFVAVLAAYVYAKHYGFSLSGFEMLAAFIIGWVIGLVIDFLRAMRR